MSADTYLCNDHRVRLGIFANGDAQQMAQLVSRGSAGCIAALDQMNPRSYVPGTQPWSGVQLTVHWGRLIGIYETIPSTILPLHLLSFANTTAAYLGVLVAIFVVQLVVTVSAIVWHHRNCSAVEPQPPSVSPYASTPEGKTALHSISQGSSGVWTEHQTCGS